MSDNTETLNRIVDQIYSLVTLEPDNAKSETPKRSTMIQLCHPGIPINEADYQNAMSTSNPGGSIVTALAFSELVNNIPKCGVTSYTPSGNKVDEAFDTCLQANAESEPDSEALTKYEKAHNYLWEAKTMKDMDGNEVQLPATPSVAYQTYLDGQTTYMAACQALQALKNQCDMNTTEGQNKYAVDSIMLVNAVNQAYTKWRSAGADLIEKALDLEATTINDVVRHAINQAKKQFEGCKISNPATGQMEHVTFATPNNWAQPSMAKNFSDVTVSHKTKEQVDRNFSRSLSGGATFSFGLWSVGSNVGYSKKEECSHSSASNMEVSMKLGTVQITRQWMNTSYFKLKGWYLTGNKQGAITTGEVPGDDGKILPLLPVQLLVARDIKISADWSQKY